jgi:hypothetical protein
MLRRASSLRMLRRAIWVETLVVPEFGLLLRLCCSGGDRLV